MMKKKIAEDRINGALNSIKPNRSVLDDAFSEMDSVSEKKVKQFGAKWKIVIATIASCILLLVAIIPFINLFDKGEQNKDITLTSTKIISIKDYNIKNFDKLKDDFLYYDFIVLESLLFQDKESDVYISEKYEDSGAVIFLNVLISNKYKKSFDALKMSEGVEKSQTIKSVIIKYKYDEKENKFSGDFIYKDCNYLININGSTEDAAKNYVSSLIK